MQHKSRSIILRVIDYGEADRLATFFTEDFGKLKGIAKHAKRSKKRFGGGLEPGTAGTFRFDEKPNVELVRLEEFTIELPAWKMTSSLASISNLGIALELADRMLPLSQASKERFDLLFRWLEFLSVNEPSMSHRHAFFYKWLRSCGLAPVFDVCATCGEQVPKKDAATFIDPSHGGTVCASCHGSSRYGMNVAADVLKYLQCFKKGRISNASSGKADEVFEYLIEHALGGKLKSLDVVKKLGI